jgi:hypothetical protein
LWSDIARLSRIPAQDKSDCASARRQWSASHTPTRHGRACPGQARP